MEQHSGDNTDDALRRQCLHELELGLFSVRYQPVMDLATEVPVGLEALARWRHRRLGHVPPATFLRFITDAAAGPILTGAVLTQVAAAAHRWPTGLDVWVNVGVDELLDAGVVDAVRRTARSLRARNQRLGLDIAREPWTTRQEAAVVATRDVGVAIALDEHRTRPPRLRSLGLPLETIKIDRRSLRMLRDTSTHELNAWTAAIALAHDAGLTVMVEGVETARDVTTARRIGADQATGWWWSSAVPEADVLTVLHRGAAHGASTTSARRSEPPPARGPPRALTSGPSRAAAAHDQ